MVAKQNVNPLSKRDCVVSIISYSFQENDSDFDTDFEDFGSDEESHSELVW